MGGPVHGGLKAGESVFDSIMTNSLMNYNRLNPSARMSVKSSSNRLQGEFTSFDKDEPKLS